MYVNDAQKLDDLFSRCRESIKSNGFMPQPYLHLPLRQRYS